MALPSIPNPASFSASNPFAGLPSYTGTDSSLNRGAASTILGNTPNYTTTNSALIQGAMSNAGLTNVPSTLSGQAESIKASLAGQTISNPSFVNPLANLVSKNSADISATINALNPIPNISNTLDKTNLDSVVNRLSGGIGSGLNGMTGSIPNVGGLNLSGATTFVAGATGSGTALGGIGNVANNTIGNVTNSLKSVTGSISNITADISGSLNKLTGGNLAGGVQESLRSVSALAGQANNILSLFRGKNLPAGGELFKTTGTPIELSSSVANDWRIRINCNFDIFNSQLFTLLKQTGGVVWPYLPSVTVATKANYTQIDTIHSNYPYQSYKNSTVDEISIDGEFTCETERDAAYWIAATTFFKTATKMFYGQGEYAGNPPIICNLTGYGASIFDKIPVVIKSFSVNLSDGVDYINCKQFGTNTWVPVLSSISVTVMPVYNRARQRKFSLKDYASGKVATGVGYI